MKHAKKSKNFRPTKGNKETRVLARQVAGGNPHAMFLRALARKPVFSKGYVLPAKYSE